MALNVNNQLDSVPAKVTLVVSGVMNVLKTHLVLIQIAMAISPFMESPTTSKEIF